MKNFLIFLPINIFFYTLPNLIIFLIFVKENFILGSELSLIYSFLIFFKELIFPNFKNLFLSKKNFTLIYQTLAYKIFISSILVFFCLVSFFFKINLIYIGFVFLFLISSIIESILIILEKKKEIHKISFLIFFINFSLILFFFIINQIELNVFIKINCFLFFLLLIILLKNIKVFIKFKNYKRIFNIITSSYSFKSSLYLNLSNFFWRFFLIYFLGKQESGILLMIYLFASFPGTIIKNTFSPSLRLIKQNNYKLFNVIFFIIYLFIATIIYYLFFNEIFIFKDMNFDEYYICIYLSLFGSFLNVLSMDQRQNLINKNLKLNNLLFITKDKFVSIVQFCINPILFLLGNFFIINSFFFLSIISFFIYFRTSK